MSLDKNKPWVYLTIPMVNNSPLYSTSEIAKLVGVSKNTLIRWEKDGLIPSAMRDGRGWRVWCKDSLNRIVEVKKSKRFIARLSSETKLEVNIIGYGNQASVWAKNLRDSGANVNVLLRSGSSSILAAKKDGFEVTSIEKGLRSGTVFCLLIPDEEHESFFKEYSSYISDDNLFIFAHGYSVGYLGLEVKARTALLAPKAVARSVRLNYLEGNKTLSCFCVSSKDDQRLVKRIGQMMGFYPLIETDFLKEAVSDLFTEQAILCGGVPALILKAFDLLRKKGIPEELIAQECIQELSYIIEIIKKEGFYSMYRAISPLAFSGAMKAWTKIERGKNLEIFLKDILDDICSGNFISHHRNFDREGELESIKEKVKYIDSAIFKNNNPDTKSELNEKGGLPDVSNKLYE